MTEPEPMSSSTLRVHREGTVIVIEDAESSIEVSLSSLANHIRALRSASGRHKTTCARSSCPRKAFRVKLCRHHYDMARIGVPRYVRRTPIAGAMSALSSSANAKSPAFAARLAAMRAMYAAGVTLMQIGREHGVTPGTVADHARRYGWERAVPVPRRRCGCRAVGPHGSGCGDGLCRAAVAERRACA